MHVEQNIRRRDFKERPNKSIVYNTRYSKGSVQFMLIFFSKTKATNLELKEVVILKKSTLCSDTIF